MAANDAEGLARLYQARFAPSEIAAKDRVWTILCKDFFSRYVKPTDRVLDVAAGRCEFINHIECAEKYAYDANPDTARFAAHDVGLVVGDCRDMSALPVASFDVVFVSNFFEHLPDKDALGRTLDEAHRCLAPGGHLIAMGPNIKYLHGAYWDFWDHHLPLTEDSLREALANRNFKVEKCVGKFMPYRMDNTRRHPLLFVRMYLRLPLAWKFFGKQFLVIAGK